MVPKGESLIGIVKSIDAQVAAMAELIGRTSNLLTGRDPIPEIVADSPISGVKDSLALIRERQAALIDCLSVLLGDLSGEE